MSRLTDATERLEAAIERLDRALVARAGGNGPEGEELRAALEQAEAEKASLEQRTSRISQRLDGAIERLKTVLEA